MKRIVLMLPVVLSCGPVVGGSGSESTSEASSGGPSSTSVVDPDSGPGPTSTRGDTTTGGDTTGADDTEGDTTGDVPASVCDPQPAHYGHALALDWDPDDPFPDNVTELEVTCTVTNIESPGGEHSIELSCEDAPHVVDVLDLGPIDLSPGEVVTLRAHDYAPWWRNTHVLLLRDEQVIVAGMTAGRWPSGPGDEFDPPGTFFEPLGVTLQGEVCDPEPPPSEDPRPCDFLCDVPCTRDRRQAIEFTSNGRSTVVYDANLGSVDGLQLSVSAARSHVEIDCADTPGAWYQFVALRVR